MSSKQYQIHQHGLMARYQQLLTAGEIQEDAQQKRAVTILERILDRIENETDPASQNNPEAHDPIASATGSTEATSLYLWGKVGRGKTWLMDMFYNALAVQAKTRTHYYRFMRDIHAHLKQQQGTANPLNQIAENIAQQSRVLCLDEFFVSDIGDAMILSNLLKALFENHVSLITTSNVEPRLLYPDGLQRDRFIPAIEMIENQMQVFNLDGTEDYRLSKLHEMERYFSPCTSANRAAMQQEFQQSSHSPIVRNLNVQVCDRPLKAKFADTQQIWFEFDEICKGARSQLDYIELAGRYQHIYIENVPQMGGQTIIKDVARGTEDTVNINPVVADRPFVQAKSDDEARRFISLVDELYDRKTRLTLCAQVPAAELYTGGRVEAEFQRTISRLFEMQTESYASDEAPAYVHL